MPIPPIDSVRLLGGEPFMREDLTLLVQEMHARGVDVSITTNGQFCDFNTLSTLVKMKVKTIVISLDGDRYAHDGIRGRGSFDRLEDFLEVLVHARNGAAWPRIDANLILQRDNHLRLEGLFNWLKQHPEIAHLHIGNVEPIGRAVEFDTRLTLQEVEKAARWIFIQHKTIPQSISIELPSSLAYLLNKKFNITLATPKGSCEGGTRDVRLFSDGRLYPCHLGEQIADRLVALGRVAPEHVDVSLRRHTFVEVYNGPLFKHFFQWVHGEISHYVEDGKMPRCPFAGRFSVDGELGFKPRILDTKRSKYD
jgi:molybdenum cofactor biosynthesis enzyme MoaA